MEKAHIFVANDEKTFLELMELLLTDEGYSVTLLHASEKAYQEIKEAAPDLLILDMTLEHPDVGWHLLQNLKLDPETVQIPIIICTADTQLLRNRKYEIEKLDCYVAEKPFDLDAMLTLVREALIHSQETNPKRLISTSGHHA